jgi:sucrose-6-phosphate hydrolase SacC (GH32 family)
MLYSEGLEDQRLALATSSDLGNWKKEGPIDLPPGKWRERKHGAPFVWRDGEEWRMLLMGTNMRDRTSLGLFVSQDGRKGLEPQGPAIGAK